MTAAFNKNLLVRLNRELGAEFDLASFRHRATWNANARRVEMHLVSLRDQEVRIPGAHCMVSLKRNESIWTESSYKYEPRRVEELGGRAGFTPWAQWVDAKAHFALTLFGVELQGENEPAVAEPPSASLPA